MEERMKNEIEIKKEKYLFFDVNEATHLYAHTLDLSDPDKFITRV